MGLQDRDWYREERRNRAGHGRHFRKKSAPKNWLWMVLFWVSVLFLLFQFVKHLDRLTFSVPFSVMPKTPPATPLAATPPSVQARPPAPSRPIEEAPPLQHQAPQAPPVPQGVATIYRCKAYAGGIFWSTAYCGTQQALIDRTATVPAGMPFEQQVEIAEAQRQEAMALYNQQPSPTVQKQGRCLALKRERETIESRYSNWQWQPLEVINPDQTRMKGLRAEQARLGCPTQ